MKQFNSALLKLLLGSSVLAFVVQVIGMEENPEMTMWDNPFVWTSLLLLLLLFLFMRSIGKP